VATTYAYNNYSYIREQVCVLAIVSRAHGQNLFRP
jgi:hypothetical protein